MTGFSASPRLLKAGLVVLQPGGGPLQRVISLQYNPDSLTRSYQVQGVGGDGGGERAQPFRFKGPAVETFRIEAEIDATDPLEHPDSNPSAVAVGIAPQLALLESLVNPSVAELLAHDALASSGQMEIVPPEAPLVIFVWGARQVVAVRVTDFSITEEAFDPVLNPIRAKVSLSLRALSTDDLGFAHKGGQIFINHLRTREALAGQGGGATLSSLGLSNLP
ncbi:MAG: hypothetical protein KGL43_05500 [Burkholderiales bacterium]|nr:hypothetical protein [Burkholderiales bacterium]MDE2396704.1 hypothetical protein [Burkholderiales bacterium]MDE2453029.1 hypothetical protein [Burkholderiales bacterium]